jgi:hypothetical protein
MSSPLDMLANTAVSPKMKKSQSRTEGGMSNASSVYTETLQVLDYIIERNEEALVNRESLEALQFTASNDVDIDNSAGELDHSMDEENKEDDDESYAQNDRQLGVQEAANELNYMRHSQDDTQLPSSFSTSDVAVGSGLPNYEELLDEQSHSPFINPDKKATKQSNSNKRSAGNKKPKGRAPKRKKRTEFRTELWSAENIKVIDSIVNFYKEFMGGKTALPFHCITLMDICNNTSRHEVKRLAQMQMRDLTKKNNCIIAL